MHSALEASHLCLPSRGQQPLSSSCGAIVLGSLTCQEKQEIQVSVISPNLEIWQ
jgi:hypothetical protein